MARHECQHAALAIHGQLVRGGHDFDVVDRPAGEAIDRVEHLKRPDKVELVDRRYSDDDDAAGTVCGCGRHGHPLCRYVRMSASGAHADGGFRRISVAIRRPSARYDSLMTHFRWLFV